MQLPTERQAGRRCWCSGCDLPWRSSSLGASQHWLQIQITWGALKPTSPGLHLSLFSQNLYRDGCSWALKAPQMTLQCRQNGDCSILTPRLSPQLLPRQQNPSPRSSNSLFPLWNLIAERTASLGSRPLASQSPVPTGCSVLLSHPRWLPGRLSPSSGHRIFFSSSPNPLLRCHQCPLSLGSPICQRVMVTAQQKMVRGLETRGPCQAWEGACRQSSHCRSWWLLPVLRRWSHHQLHDSHGPLSFLSVYFHVLIISTLSSPLIFPAWVC